MKDHIIELDYIRALAILLIVLCHLHYYIQSSFLDKWSVFPLAFLGLNIFFMLSGFLLNHNRKIKSKDDIINYTRKRIRRIYPLYWLAFVVLILFDLLNIGQQVGIYKDTRLIFLNILGLQGLFPKSYTVYGLWFIGVILLYYLVYIFICAYSKSINEILIRSFIILIPFIILKIKFGLIITDFFVYYPVFVGGIIAAEVKDSKTFLNVLAYYIIIMLSLCIMYFFGFLHLKTILIIASYPMFSFIVTFLFVVYGIYSSKRKDANIFLKTKNKTVSLIASNSLSIYLFHTPVLIVTRISLYKVEAYNTLLYDFLILFIGLPLVFIFGYYIPKISKL